jgi:hypothetical protein
MSVETVVMVPGHAIVLKSVETVAMVTGHTIVLKSAKTVRGQDIQK